MFHESSCWLRQGIHGRLGIIVVSGVGNSRTVVGRSSCGLVLVEAIVRWESEGFVVRGKCLDVEAGRCWPVDTGLAYRI